MLIGSGTITTYFILCIVAKTTTAVRVISSKAGNGCNEVFTTISMHAVLRINQKIMRQDDEDVEAPNNPVTLQFHHPQPYNTDGKRVSNVEDPLVQV